MINRKQLVPIILGAFLLTGCFSEDKSTINDYNMQNLPPLKVSTYKVKLQDIPVSLEYPAKIKSIQQVNVVARVAGILEKKNFTEGSFVKKGDILYQIDSLKYETLVQEAQADVELKKATLKQATREWKRIKTLFQQDAISQKERDSALATYEIAQASLKASQANLKKQQIDLDYTKVKAPISGLTSLSIQDIGSYIESDESRKLITITKMNPIYVEFSFPDIELSKKRFNFINDIKLPVSIYFSNGLEYEQKGTLNFINSFVDNETSTVKARAIFKNLKNDLLPGLFVHIKIEGFTYKNVINIPQTALLQDVAGTFVYIVKNNKAIKTPVKIGNIVKDTYLINDGLKKGDLVITNNLTKLKPGSNIELVSKE